MRWNNIGINFSYAGTFSIQNYTEVHALVFYIIRNEGCLQEALFSVSAYPDLGVSNLMMACKVRNF